MKIVFAANGCEIIYTSRSCGNSSNTGPYQFAVYLQAMPLLFKNVNAKVLLPIFDYGVMLKA